VRSAPSSLDQVDSRAAGSMSRLAQPGQATGAVARTGDVDRGLFLPAKESIFFERYSKEVDRHLIAPE
jgi:hypothetical protein